MCVDTLQVRFERWICIPNVAEPDERRAQRCLPEVILVQYAAQKHREWRPALTPWGAMLETRPAMLETAPSLTAVCGD